MAEKIKKIRKTFNTSKKVLKGKRELALEIPEEEKDVKKIKKKLKKKRELSIDIFKD